MRKTLLFVITFSGLTAVSTIFVRQYHFVNVSKTWAEAQSYCRKKFTDLATVKNLNDNSRLQKKIQGHENFAWIGLYDDLTRWKWALGYADFNNSIDFSNWKSNEPDNMGSSQHCTVMANRGEWRDTSCVSLRPAVCFHEQGPSNYIFVKTEMTWSEAMTYCRSNYTDLVSVRNMTENDLVQLACSVVTDNTWIGLHREPWARWSDSSNTTFTNWHSGQPDNSGDTMTSCAAVNATTGTWWDVDCEEKHYFICHKKVRLQHKKAFKLKFKSEADLKDPALQQQILEQLHAKLEKNGLPDFKLRWIQTDEQTFHKEQKGKKQKV